MFAIALVALLVTSLVAPIAAAGMTSSATSAQQSPPVLDQVPAENVGPPDQANGLGPGGQGPRGDLALPDAVPTDAAAWDIRADRYAGDLAVEIGETSDGELVLRLSDQTNHGARSVAVDASTLVESVGHRPQKAHGVHSSGDQWSREIRYRDGMAMWTVPKFSTNDVTFSGELTISGTPSEDGARYTYNLSDGDSPDNFSVNVTGHRNTQSESTSQAGLASGESISLSVGGTDDPSGPSTNNEPTVTFEGSAPASQWKNSVSGKIWAIEAGTNNEYVYAGNETGTLYKLHAGNGSVVWEKNLHSDRLMDLEVKSNYLVTAGYDSDVHKVGLDGSVTWTYTGVDSKAASVAINSSDHILVGGDEADGRVHNVDSSGTQVWTYTTNAWNLGLTVSRGDYVYIASRDQNLYKLDPVGAEMWNKTLTGNDLLVAAKEPTDYIYVGDVNGNLVKVDPDSTIVWNKTVHSGSIEDISVTSENRVVTVSNDQTAKKYDSTGSMEWSYSTAQGTKAVGLGSRRILYLIDELNQPSRVESGTVDPSVDLDDDGTVETSYTGFLTAGETATKELASLSTSTSTASVGTANGSTVDMRIDYTEITDTVDPTIEVNGHTASYSGELADGETTSLDVSNSWLQSGENILNVTVSKSYAGPIGQVGLNYSHSATDIQSVNYRAESFSERYNVSKTFAYDSDDTQLTIPFKGNVMTIRNLEKRINGSSWQTVAESEYSLENTTLSVDLGNVSADTTVEVRSTGSKVAVHNGSIQVLEPTVKGDQLESKFEFTEYSSDTYLDISNTQNGDYTHYLYDESWSAPEEYARVTADGTQHLHIPKAGAGETARVATIPLEPAPSSGDVQVEVESSGAEPEFSVRPGETSGDAVEFVWHDTTSGTTYELYSVTDKMVLDTDTAQSPVYLTGDDSSQTLQIRAQSGGSSGSTSVGGGGIVPSSPGNAIPIWGIAGVVTVLLTGWFVMRRDDSVDGSSSSSGSSSSASSLVGTLSALLTSPVGLTVLAAGILAMAVRGGLVLLPPQFAATMLLLAVPVVTWVALKRLGIFSWGVFGITAVMTAIFGMELIAPGSVVPAIGSGLGQFTPVLGLGLLYLVYSWLKARQAEANTPDEVNRINIGSEDD
jgi:hypothetical protein